MAIKLCGVGFKRYAGDAFNIFDALIVVISTVELAFEKASGSGGKSAMTIFRGFRIIRIFKLVNIWENLSLLLAVIGRTI